MESTAMIQAKNTSRFIFNAPFGELSISSYKTWDILRFGMSWMRGRDHLLSRCRAFTYRTVIAQERRDEAMNRAEHGMRVQTSGPIIPSVRTMSTGDCGQNVKKSARGAGASGGKSIHSGVGRTRSPRTVSWKGKMKGGFAGKVTAGPSATTAARARALRPLGW